MSDMAMNTGRQIDERGVYMERNMKGRYADIVDEKMKEMEFDFVKKTKGKTTMFVLFTQLDNAPGFKSTLSIDEDGDSRFRCYIAQSVPENRRQDIATECNRLNTEYRFIRLAVDDDGDICAAYDFALFGDEAAVAAHAGLILCLCVAAIDQCIPEIMKCLWDVKNTECEQEHIKINPFQTEGGNK